MKILTKEETSKFDLSMKNGRPYLAKTLKIFSALNVLEVGQSVIFSGDEYGYSPATCVSSNVFNKYFKKKGLLQRFRMRRLNDGKEYILIRII